MADAATLLTISDPDSAQFLALTPQEKIWVARRLVAADMSIYFYVGDDGVERPYDGSVAAYRALSQADQVALTDRLGAFIKAHPSSFTAQQNTIAQNIVDSPLYNQPLADPGFWSNALEYAETGLVNDSLKNAGKYLLWVGLGIGGLILLNSYASAPRVTTR